MKFCNFPSPLDVVFVSSVYLLAYELLLRPGLACTPDVVPALRMFIISDIGSLAVQCGTRGKIGRYNCIKVVFCRKSEYVPTTAAPT